MEEIREGLHLLLRWIHVIAAIAWIGHAFIFNEWDETLIPPDDDDEKERVQGELWMVHGGGFYQLVKHKAFPEVMRGPLHWFKWEAAFTWLSGFFLLTVLYYMGGGVYLLDPSVSDIGQGGAILLGIGTLLGSWLVYDLTWSTVGQKSEKAAIGVTLALIVGATYLVSQLLSGRAAFIHVGAMLATWMAANVWVRIIPNMTKMVAGAKPGDKLNPEHGRLAKQRSKHNNYFIYPVLFVMISNHYPSTYGHPHAWLVLLSMMTAAAGVKHLMNVKRASPGGIAAILLGILGLILVNVDYGGAEEADVPDATGPRQAQAVDPATAGKIRGVALYEGEPPPREELTLAGGCEQLHDGPLLDDSLVVSGGQLANVFVWIEDSMSAFTFPAPAGKVVMDQRGCMYSPHVVGARVGQEVEFLNSDPLFHNVRSLADANPVFNEITAAKDAHFTKVFRRPEVMVQAKCDVHPWMKGFIGVVPHPFFATTGESGAFTLEGVPPGAWTLSAWHERLGRKSMQVVVPPSGEAAATFSFAPKSANQGG